ncbi:hypothetical protein HDU80_010847 [Chytriomyces hyalinus]|nr:hypothetical protein HDU80_010847 [Chytriomyces hyalinus]
MNQEDVRKMLKDFRRLRCEIVDRSDYIISMFEAALKTQTTGATPDPSPEQMTYQEFGIRLTVDDYTGSAELSPHQSGVSLFAESDKRVSARTGKSIRRKPPSEQGQSHISIRTMPSILRNKRASQPDTRGLAKFMDMATDGNFPTTSRRESKARDEIKRVQKQTLEVSDSDSSSPLNMAMVSMSASGFPVSSSNSFCSPDSAKSSNDVFARLKQEPILVPLRDVSSDLQPGCSVALSTTHSIFLQPSESADTNPDKSLDNNNNSSSSRGTSALSFQIEERTTSNPVSPNLEVPSSFAPSRSLLREPSKHSTKSISPKVFVPVPTKPAEQRVPIPPATPPTATPSPPQSTLANIFLLPAYDHKGRRVTTEQLSAFGTLSINFRVNGIHPRSLFSNVWDLFSALVIFSLLWIIPVIISYNGTYALMNVDHLSICITVIFAVDSVINLFTPRLVEGDFTFDFVEYEKARPTLAVWVEDYFRQAIFIEIFTLIPFTIFLHSATAYELLLLIPLIRVYKLKGHLLRCPTVTNLAWRIDDLAAAPISKIIPIIAGIFLFAHFNACSIFLMGRVSGFVGWESLWPLWPVYKSSHITEVYVWTFYKAIGNIFPTSLNPWTMGEQIVALVYIILAAIVYAVFLGSISSAVMAFNPSGRLFHQKIGELRDYIRWKDLSKDTEVKLLSYYESRYRGKYFEEDAVLADFNDSLKAEILLHNTRKLIERVPFLKRSEDDGRDELFIGRIAGALHSYNYIPGDYVTKQGDSGSDMYFILSGKADVYVNKNKVVTLSAGTYFGEVGLITKTLRTATVQCALPSLMYRLTYSDFHMILDDFPDMKLRIHRLAAEREKVVKMAENNR